MTVMPHTDETGELSPLVQPHVIRFLKERDKVVGGGLREEILEELEEVVVQRRTADTVASRVAHQVTKTGGDVGQSVMEGRVRDRLSQVNERALNNI